MSFKLKHSILNLKRGHPNDPYYCDIQLVTDTILKRNDWFYQLTLYQNIANWMPNNSGPDQTAPSGPVWSGSALSAQELTSQYLWYTAKSVKMCSHQPINTGTDICKIDGLCSNSSAELPVARGGTTVCHSSYRMKNPVFSVAIFRYDSNIVAGMLNLKQTIYTYTWISNLGE